MREVYISHSWNDLRAILRIKFGYEQTKAYQDLEVLTDVLSQALGESKSKPKPVSSANEAEQKMVEMFGAGSVMSEGECQIKTS